MTSKQNDDKAPQQGETAGAIPQVVATAPKRIYLDLGFDPAEEDAPFSELDEVTWSADNASGHGIEYVRADLADATCALRAVAQAGRECNNEACGWVGPVADAVHPKHDSTTLLCPQCHETTEAAPVAAAPMSAEPSDADAWRLWISLPLTGNAMKSHGKFARAVLARWGSASPTTVQAGGGLAEERALFKEQYRHLDLAETADAWGRPKFQHSHVDALWAGWRQRAAVTMLSAAHEAIGAATPADTIQGAA